MFDVLRDLHQRQRAERAGNPCDIVGKTFRGVAVGLRDLLLKLLGRILIKADEVGQQNEA